MKELKFLNTLDLNTILARALHATQDLNNPNQWYLENNHTILVEPLNKWTSLTNHSKGTGAIELVEHWFSNKKNQPVLNDDDIFSSNYNLSVSLLKNTFKEELKEFNHQEEIRTQINEKINISDNVSSKFNKPFNYTESVILQKQKIISLLTENNPTSVEFINQELNSLISIVATQIINDLDNHLYPGEIPHELPLTEDNIYDIEDSAEHYRDNGFFNSHPDKLNKNKF